MNVHDNPADLHINSILASADRVVAVDALAVIAGPGENR